MIDRRLAGAAWSDIEALLAGDPAGDVLLKDDLRAYAESRRTTSGGLRMMALRDNDGDALLLLGAAGGGASAGESAGADADAGAADADPAADASPGAVPADFAGTIRDEGGRRLLIARQDGPNAAALRSLLPELAPVPVGAQRSSFGLGDRLGLASPGHIPLFRNRDVVPVLAQQSLRELDLMGRSYAEVIDAATWAVFNTGYAGPWAADGDHLKTPEAVASAVAQGCTMITADLSDHLAFEYLDVSPAEASEAYKTLDTGWRRSLEDRYDGERRLADGTVLNYDPETRQRIALVYGRALDHAEELYRAGRSAGGDFDFEVSIDETERPTTPEAHYFVARELKERKVPFTSLAPRFVGEFQKGIDYIGNVDEFAASFAVHAAVAGDLGYKISVHSSSDKFSVYPVIGERVQGAYHVKTSGTNWLVALETLSRADPEFFRELFARAYAVFPTARTYYHITPDMDRATDITGLDDQALPEVFTNATDRQVLHVSYGEMFRDANLKARYFARLRAFIEAYWAALEAHIGRHLELLGARRGS